MGVKYEDRYCFTCDSYDEVEVGRNTCPECSNHLADEDSEISDAALNNSDCLAQVMAYKLMDALERIEELESELYKLKLP